MKNTQHITKLNRAVKLGMRPTVCGETQSLWYSEGFNPIDTVRGLERKLV